MNLLRSTCDRGQAVDVAVSPHRRIIVQRPSSAPATETAGRLASKPPAVPVHGHDSAEEGRRAGFEQGLSQARAKVDEQVRVAREEVERTARQRDALQA